MTTKFVKEVWENYPGSRLHCDVTTAGPNSYHVVVSLIDKQDNIVATVEHYDSGPLFAVKEAAFEMLLEKIKQVATA